MISTIYKQSESKIYVCDIMNKVEDNKYLLCLGHKILHPQQEVANRYLYGIILDRNGEFKVSNEITDKIVVLADNNLPTIESIGKLEMVNTLSSTIESDENEKSSWSQCDYSRICKLWCCAGKCLSQWRIFKCERFETRKRICVHHKQNF